MDRSRIASLPIALGLMLAIGAPAWSAAPSAPKLKYRGKGPVCSCESGLGEAEIERAMKRITHGTAGEAPPARTGDAGRDGMQPPRGGTDEKSR